MDVGLSLTRAVLENDLDETGPFDASPRLDDDFTTSIYLLFDALSTAHHSAYRICIFWSHLIPRHGSSTFDTAHFPSLLHHSPQIRTGGCSLCFWA